MADSWEDNTNTPFKPKGGATLNASAKPFLFDPSGSTLKPHIPAYIPTHAMAAQAQGYGTQPPLPPEPASAKPFSAIGMPTTKAAVSMPPAKAAVAIGQLTRVVEKVEDIVIEEKFKAEDPKEKKEEEQKLVQEEEEEEVNQESAEVTDEDPRSHINVVFIGHVDAGKSTLSGNILYLMDQVDKRTIERYEKEAKQRNRESWFLAFIMDTSEEERAKGKTVEVGRAHFETENKRFTILDAPGHKNYVPNMIQGASQADVGILVISARKGEFETGFERGGQTREHAMLAKTLGVNKLVVVINKMDEADWSVERYDECVQKLRPFLKGSGYAVKRDVTFIPISGLTGQNVKEPIDKETAPWYDGMALIPFLDQMDVGDRDPSGPLRVPVLDRYQERGTIALGKVESGLLTTGGKVVIMPTNHNAIIHQVFINDIAVRTAKPGENVTVKISCGLDELKKGFVICNRSRLIRHVKNFKAQIALIDLLDHRPLFTAGYTAILHIHTVTEECVITHLLSEKDKKSGEMSNKKPRFVKQGAVVHCRIQVEQSICIETYEEMPQMGRFTIRDEGKTIGIGIVLALEE